MRIPTSKIYRAFPELDIFTDEQCYRFMKRIEVSGVRKVLPTSAFIVVTLVGLAISCAVSGIVLSLIEDGLRQHRTGNTLSVADAVVVIFFIAAPVFIGLIVRDVLLRRHLRLVINEKLERVRCLDCRYVLIGQVPRDGKVTCSECGRVHLLSQLGIVEEDLIPPDMADPTGHAYV